MNLFKRRIMLGIFFDTEVFKRELIQLFKFYYTE